MSQMIMSKPIMLTKAQALEIQAKQVNHYVEIYGEKVRELVAAETHPETLDDRPYQAHEIHRVIPCGGYIENILRRAGLKMR